MNSHFQKGALVDKAAMPVAANASAPTTPSKSYVEESTVSTCSPFAWGAVEDSIPLLLPSDVDEPSK